MAKGESTKVTMMKDVTLDTTANISFIVKKNQSIKTGDPLIIFEDGYDDPSVSAALDQLGDKFNEKIAEIAQKTIQSHYTGKIVDIKIYRNRDIKDFSKSGQRILNKYNSSYSTKEKIIKENMKNSKEHIYNSNIPELNKIDSDKIKGKDVNGMYIEFYIEYEDTLSVGDKITAKELAS